MRSLILLVVLFATANSFANAPIPKAKPTIISKEIDDSDNAIYYLSFCADRFTKFAKLGAWIGKTEKWVNTKTGDYGFNYTMYNLVPGSLGETFIQATLYLTAKKIEDAPADGSDVTVSCLDDRMPD